MKTQVYYGLISSLIFILPACHSPETRAINQNKSKDTSMNTSTATTGSKELNESGNKGSRKQGRDYSFHAKVTEDDHHFMDEVKNIDMMEITLGTLAQRSTDSKIKDFGNRMIRDHHKLDKELEQLASAANIVLRVDYSAKQQEELKMMRGLTAGEFDKQYKAMMIKGHEQALEIFKRGSDTNEEAVKNFANQYISVIENHYEEAKKL